MRPSILLALAVVLLAGCSSLPEREPAPAPSPAPPSSDMAQAGHVANYAASLQALVQGNATAQAEVMASARSGYDQAKAGPASLLYGLLLAAPGHPQRDVKSAQRVLQEALAHPELLTLAERALGAVELARADTELRLVAEIDRLVADLQQERENLRAATSNTALNRRLQAEMEESARLRKALDEAKNKLDAITRMERNLSDRPPAPEGRIQ
jgi:hypothetical protein